jgi:hypothetical protein
MKKLTLLTLTFFLSGCLEKELIPERDHARTDSALVVIERLMRKPSSEDEIKRLKEEYEKSGVNKLKNKPLVLQKVEAFQEKEVDTLFLEKTITMIYTKSNVGGFVEMILDSINIHVDSCLHLSNSETKNP